MFIKQHYPSDYYQYLLAVDGRLKLHDTDYINIYRYKLGEEGERQFYNRVKNIMEGFKIWDVTLRENGTSQYDFIIVVGGVIYHYDIKNYSGTYTYKNDNFISENGRNYKNILSQLDGAYERLKRIVRQQGWKYTVESRIIFINEKFSIRNYDGNALIMFSNQVENIIQHLKGSTTYKMDLYVAEKLLSLNSPDEFERIFYYPIENMTKGIRCPKCKKINSVKVMKKYQNVHCKCGHCYAKSDMLHHVTHELSIINRGKIKENHVTTWSGVPERSVRNFLVKHYQKHGTYRDAYYTLN